MTGDDKKQLKYGPETICVKQILAALKALSGHVFASIL